jgi:DNA-binding MarR family transcriptional regulator
MNSSTVKSSIVNSSTTNPSAANPSTGLLRLTRGGRDGAARPASRAVAPLAADLRVALMRMARRIRAEKSDRDLSDGQYSVLAYLDREGPATPSTLADHERVRPPSMTRTLTGLLDAGLVARHVHPDDGRQVLVALTEAGRRVVRETRRRRDAWLTRRLAELTPDERAVLARATDILRRIAEQ